MNILKTFETFLKEPLSILRENFIQIVSLQTGNLFAQKPPLEFNFLKKGAQLTVIDNEKMYNFLSLATHRAANRENKREESERKNESA